MYILIKRMIETGNYDRLDLEKKINVFYLKGQLTDQQYEELMGMLEKNEIKVEK